MSLGIIIGILVVVMALLALLVVVLAMGAPFGPKKLRRQAAVSDSLRSLVLAQRNQSSSGSAKNKENLAFAAAAEVEQSRKAVRSSSKMSFAKLLRYGRWPITVVQFRALQLTLAVLFFLPAYYKLTMMWVVLAPNIGWGIPAYLLRKSVNRRFNAFDIDYPVLLLSYVSLLKTGMTTIPGLEAAAKGLDDGSLVRAEVELLIERLRLGLTEEQAINAFGEDVAHPEIELFVQGLILSRRVGGQLSATLERLAKQVRKRQEFRKRALAAVGMEKGSMWAVSFIMAALIVYIGYASPELVFPAFKNDFGIKVVQFGAGLIFMGFYWMSNVTNIKV